MKKLSTCIFLCITTYSITRAQLSDNFSDGNMSDDPAWGGDISKFEIDASQKLHLNGPAEASQAYLSTASEAVGESEWLWDAEITANPSSTNFCKVYLISDQTTLDGSLQGYFVKIGGTTDEVSLYRQDGLSEILIINGSDRRVNVSLVQLSVKVKRDMDGNWSLETKLPSEASFTTEGTVFDNTYTSSTHFGVFCKYTATRSSAFYFDNFVVSGGPIPDLRAPKLLSHLPSSNQEIKLHFSEPLLNSSALQTAHYLLNGQQPVNVSYTNDTVRLLFSSPFPNAVTQSLSVSGVADESNNLMGDTLVDVFYFEKVKASWGSLVINEIFPDPTPSLLNLPDESDAEFIEIYNPSIHPYNLEHWTINGKSLPSFILLPAQYVLLCKPAYKEIFEAYGPTLSLSSWPTLSNTGGSILLSDDETRAIDSIHYTSAGMSEGISLERIYMEAPCGGESNLAASKNPNGATPGGVNTVFSDEADFSAPELLQLSVIGGDSLMLTFSEKIYLPQPYETQFLIDDDLNPHHVSYPNQDSSQLLLAFEKPLASHAHHRLNIAQAYDCSGNTSNSLQRIFYLDWQPPFIEQIFVLDTAEIVVMFSEKLLKASAEKESNYTIIPSGENPKKALLGNDSLSVRLSFSSTLAIEDSVWLSIQALEDLYQNRIPVESPLTSHFIYHSQIDSVHIINEHQIDILLKVAPDKNTVLNVLHYEIDRSIGHPARVILDSHDAKVVHLLLPKALTPNKQHTLTVSNLLDEQQRLLSTPRYYFFYDTKGPTITEVKATNASEITLFFDETIFLKPEQKLKLWINKDTVDIASYTLSEKHMHLKLAGPLVQEREYVVSVEGVSDAHAHLSNPSQNFAFLLDQVPPQLDTAYLYSPHELMLIFHEPVLTEEVSADHYLQLIQPAYLPSQVKFYHLTPEKVVFSFEETLEAGHIHFQVNQFSDRQQNRMLSPLDYQITHQPPCVGHIVPLANNHLRLHFTSDIAGLELKKENFLLEGNTLPDSVSPYTAHQLDLWFDQSFSEFTKYQLSFSYENRKQTVGFLYQDFVESVTHDGNSTVKIQFSVSLETSTAEQLENYTLALHGHPLAAVYIPEQQLVQLLFSGTIDRENLHTLSLQGLLDTDLSHLPHSTHFFGMGRIPGYQEILITEIMAKPAPSAALPEYEYVELYNASIYPLQLKSLKLADAQKTVSLNEKWLSPGEYLILCSTSAVEHLSAYGSCMGVSGFPSLNDATDTLRLLNSDGQEIHTVAYSEDWYNDASKKKGGWSLEMIDMEWPCQRMHNWTASVSPAGGTPGKTNSVQQSNPDLQAPQLLQAVAIDSLHILLTFDEALAKESLQEAKLNLKDITIDAIVLQGEYHLKVRLNSPLQAGFTYTLAVSHVVDCSGNQEEKQSLVDIMLPESHQRNDILVSEILFHTRPGGVDFVELYNNSDKHLSLKQWKLATERNGAISNLSLISDEALVLAPQAYLAVTKDKNTLTADYPQALKGQIYESKAFPSLLADGGTLLLMDEKEHIMQSIDFSPDWHHPLLQEPRGVSLERISWNEDENERQYWQSAASDAGYATPGYQNSQWQHLTAITQPLQVDPPIFYPDQSGYLDYTRIHFQLGGSGQMGNLKIFDARGRMVRQLAQNQSLSEEGFFIWDGTDDFKKRVNIGYYIIWMEVFRPDGSVNILKSKVAVASKF